ncbi:MAG: argininosuccinate lyase [Clostridiaceae bacterium]|jgi:argininosuccinate lyase|nr:argininosuccinate lyase [Clostridiaceae bacterium]
MGINDASGRLDKKLEKAVNDFNSSIRFDGKLYREDIEGSIAHAKMLSKCGILEKSEADKIVRGLKSVLADIASGKTALPKDAEDIHMFVEEELVRRIGDSGKNLHVARSRNDQVALDTRLYLRGKTDEIVGAVKNLLREIAAVAADNTDTLMPAYTHLQKAQPVTFAHHLMAYAAMLMRDISRIKDCKKRMNISPLGSGAVAATTFETDRDEVARLLKFDGVTNNSIDGVSDRDFCIELASVIAILMMHLSRFSEEIILWCSSEFKYIELDDGYATSSSMMPQKKNPDIAELVRGKTGRTYGNLVALLTVMKGLPLAYNKDMQEDKEAVFDSVETVLQCLNIFAPMLKTATVNKEKMRAATLSGGYMNATDCADYLTKKGMPFRDAYTLTGAVVKYCVKAQIKDIADLSLSELKVFSPLFENDVYDALDAAISVALRKCAGGPSPESVEKEIATLKAFIGKS